MSFELKCALCAVNATALKLMLAPSCLPALWCKKNVSHDVRSSIDFSLTRYMSAVTVLLLENT